MKPGGMQLAARRSDGMSSGHGLAPWAANALILELIDTARWLVGGWWWDRTKKNKLGIKFFIINIASEKVPRGKYSRVCYEKIERFRLWWDRIDLIGWFASLQSSRQACPALTLSPSHGTWSYVSHKSYDDMNKHLCRDIAWGVTASNSMEFCRISSEVTAEDYYPMGFPFVTLWKRGDSSPGNGDEVIRSRLVPCCHSVRLLVVVHLFVTLKKKQTHTHKDA